MITASVGFQCPECVREGSRSVREARTIFGGRATTAGDATVTKILIAINAVVFLFALMAGAAFIERFVMVGRALLPQTGEVVGVAEGEWYRLLTAAFLHEQLWHFALNMFVLWMLGTAIEPMLGRLRFTGLYLLSALGGSAASFMFNPPRQGSLGASGAIFGLIGAWIVIARKLRLDMSPIMVWVGINLLLPFYIPNIDWRAHLGGLITGVLIGLAYVYAPRERRNQVQGVAVVVTAAVITAVVILRTTQIAAS